jgi:hypothetical protein
VSSTHTPRIGDTIDVHTPTGWAIGVVSWTGYDALSARLDNGTTWQGSPADTRPVAGPVAAYGDIVTIDGQGDATWRVVHVAPSTPTQRAEGEGPHMYALVHTVTGKPTRTSKIQPA